jgi:hypothetical protein
MFFTGLGMFVSGLFAFAVVFSLIYISYIRPSVI